MKRVSLSTNHADFTSSILDTILQQLAPEIDRCASVTDYTTDYAFINLVKDTTISETVLAVAHAKKKLQPRALIVIGIGGSNLATMAVQQALLGMLYNELRSQALQIYYADTTDSSYISQILSITESHLQRGEQVLLNIVSKSGTTLETVANASLFIALLQQYRSKDYADYIVATTDKHSSLWIQAQQEQWSLLEIEAHVGGRYSVFSPVALFPLAMLGIDISELLEGAAQETAFCLRKDHTNYAAVSAAWRYHLSKKGYSLTNLFLFSNELSGVGAWWRQLTAESLGKAFKKDGPTTRSCASYFVKTTKDESKGRPRNHDVVVPLVSIGSTDLHSIGQLYCANITPIITTFITLAELATARRSLPNLADLPVRHSPGRSNATAEPGSLDEGGISEDGCSSSLSSVMHAIIRGIQTTYTAKDMPFQTCTLPEKTAFYIGSLLQLMMFETVYLAYLLDLNPFDQPAVEQYKEETRKILADE